MGTQAVNTVVNTGPISVYPAHVGETEAQALHRLAAQAKAQGVEIVIDEDNRHWATSASRPGERYVVSLLACSCPGFIRHRRCHHLALCLAKYHSLPPSPSPRPLSTTPRPRSATSTVPGARPRPSRSSPTCSASPTTGRAG